MLLVQPLSLLLFSGPLPARVPQEAQALFDAATVALPKGVAPFRRLADLDLDGDPDAVGVTKKSDSSAYRFYAYRNGGPGTFTTSHLGEQVQPLASTSKLVVELGHLNADAWPDACVAALNELGNWGLVQEWHGNGDGTFSAQPPSVLTYSLSAIALADLNGDGLDDLVSVNRARLRVTIGGFTNSLSMSGAKHGLRVLPDDGPGGSDVFVVDAAGEVRLAFGDTEIGLVEGPSFPHGIAMSMLDTGDVDGDGDVDAVVFGMTSYRVLRRLGVDSWELEPERIGGPATFLQDVDGDGDLDGVCCGGGGGGPGGSYPDNVLPSDFELALNDGAGGFAPAFRIHGVGSPELAGVADVDGDGDVDLIAGRCVYFADGAIRPRPGTVVDLPGGGPRSLCDWDGDGDVDLGFSVDSVHVNDGTGGFERLVTPAWPAPPGTEYRGPGYPGDFDGDGDDDLLVELRPRGGTGLGPHLRGGRAADVLMGLLRNDGYGALLPARAASRRGVSFALEGTDPELSLLADVDQDGDLDLFTRTRSYGVGGGSRLWANDGPGTFRAGGELGYRALWAGDVDLDGVLDVVGGGSGYGGRSTYLLRGSNPAPGQLPTLTWDSRFRGSLGAGWFHEADAGLSVLDYDLDGYPDFASVNWPSLNHTLPHAEAFNNRYASGGTFGTATIFSTYLELTGRMVAAGGLPQIALISALEDELDQVTEVRLKTFVGPVSYSSFQTRSQQVLPWGQLVDLDGDGRLDVLGSWVALQR